jgi:hypothetical protein
LKGCSRGVRWRGHILQPWSRYTGRNGRLCQGIFLVHRLDGGQMSNRWKVGRAIFVPQWKSCERRTPLISCGLTPVSRDEVNRRLQSFQTPEKLDYTLEIDRWCWQLLKVVSASMNMNAVNLTLHQESCRTNVDKGVENFKQVVWIKFSIWKYLASLSACQWKQEWKRNLSSGGLLNLVRLTANGVLVSVKWGKHWWETRKTCCRQAVTRRNREFL